MVDFVLKCKQSTRVGASNVVIFVTSPLIPLSHWMGHEAVSSQRIGNVNLSFFFPQHIKENKEQTSSAMGIHTYTHTHVHTHMHKHSHTHTHRMPESKNLNGKTAVRFCRAQPPPKLSTPISCPSWGSEELAEHMSVLHAVAMLFCVPKTRHSPPGLTVLPLSWCQRPRLQEDNNLLEIVAHSLSSLHLNSRN